MTADALGFFERGPCSDSAVTPIAQPSIKRFDGASVWRAQRQQAEQEWKSGPDSLHIVMQLQITSHNRHDDGKSCLHQQNLIELKSTHHAM